MAKASLLVIQGIDQGARFQLSDESIEIGRGGHNGIRLLDTEVSRSHAVLEHDEGGYLLLDRNSSNGTFVNGEPVRTNRLSDGDQIQVGRSVILFTCSPDQTGSTTNAANRVDIVSPDSLDHPSNIIEQIGQEAGSELFAPSAASHGPAVAQAIANLQVLYRISEESARRSVPIEQMLQRILELTNEVVGADRGCMFLSNTDTGELTPQVFSHGPGADTSTRMQVSRSIVDFVRKNLQGVRTSDAQSDSRFAPGQSILQAGIREAMCVPMLGRYGLLGVIYVDTTTPPERVLLEGAAGSKFNEDLLRLLVAIARQSALAIENHGYQKALVNAERLAAIGQTIATLSHHIKNILQGVRGGSYLIDLGLKEHNEEYIHKGWNIVDKNQGKIYHFVMDMLTFSKERQPILEHAALNDTVSDVCELMQARAAEFGVKFECVLRPDVPISTFEPEGIHRAVLNIVTNAIEAVEDQEDGSVMVETGYDSESDKMYIVITDNGPGIPEDQLSRIFNLFESTKGARGTGLGLAVSQKIVREHGGEITVQSKPNEGCRFVLAWPRIDDERHGNGHTSAE